MRNSKLLRSLICFLAFVPAAFGSFIVQPSGLDVNGVPVASPDFNDTTPAAPAGATNLLWSVSGSDISGSFTRDPSGVGVNAGSSFGSWINSTQTSTAAWSRPFAGGKGTFTKGSPMPDTGWARGLTVTIAAAMPQGRTLTAKVFKNDEPTALTVSIPPGAAAGDHASVDANFIRFLESDALIVQFDNVSTGGSASIASWSLDWASDNAAALIGTGIQDLTNAASTTQFYTACDQTRSTAESVVQIPWPVAGTFSFMYVLTDSTQPATGTFDIILRVNTADSLLRVDVPAGGLLGAYNDAVNSVAVAQADLIDFAAVNNATGASAQLSGIMTRFVVGTGSSVLCGIHGSLPVAGTTIHLAPFGQTEPTVPTQTDFAVTRAGTIQNLHILTRAAANADGGVTATFQKNGVDTALLVNVPALAGAGTFADTVNSFPVVQGDLVRVKFVSNSASNGPNMGGWGAEFAQ